MSIFLIGAVGFISATDDFDDVVDSSNDYVDGYVDDSPVSDDNAGSSNEKVKLTVTMNWKDNGGSNRPTSVTVYVKNGNNTVETVVLSKDNGWSKTIDVDKYDGSGNQISYSVSADKIGSYKEPVVKSNGSVFTITNELSGGVLSSSNTDVVKENNSNNSVNNGTDNSTDDNGTADENKTSEDNKTDNGKKTDKTTNNNSTNITINKNTNVNNTTINQVILKKSPNENHKNDTKKQDQKKPLHNTGNPLLILVVAIVIVGVAYYFYSKR